MKKIGIFPTVELFQDDNPYADRYEFVNIYPKRIYEANAIPIGLLLNDGEINYDVLNECDAFLLPGGHRINRNTYKLLYYAYTNKIPVLGICQGMQSLGVFSIVLDECQKQGVDFLNDEEQSKVYDYLKNNSPMLERIDNDIHLHVINRENKDSARHIVNLSRDSLIYSIYNQDSVNKVSLHSIKLNRVGSILNVVGTSSDNVIEAIENKELNWVGVQYHPEIDDDDTLIKEFIEKVKERDL